MVSVGNKVELNNFDRWLRKSIRIVNEAHVLYVHTKYMLDRSARARSDRHRRLGEFLQGLDRLERREHARHRGNQAVADVYLGEFMRLFSHYAFRESLTFKANRRTATSRRRSTSCASVAWIDGERPGAGYFEPGSARALRRLYFSGQ